MTEQEVLDGINYEIEHDMVDGYWKKHLSVAATALEKQIPYKPTDKKLTAHFGTGKCKCGQLMEIHYSYCWQCGQKLDWS